MAVKRYDGSQWVTVAGKGDQGTSSSITTWVKTASGGETSLSGNDDNSQALSYTVGQELVFINGTLLKRGSDYTATDGTTITGLAALAANDVATVWTVVAFSVTNAISNTLVDAKGDLVTASGADVPARLAVGNNGETLVADSSATTGLRWAEPKTSNPFLNSAFQIWQRGTSIAGANSNTYTADRWCGYRTGSTYSRQTTGDTTNLPNIQYCMRVQRDSGGTGTSAIYLTQALETINSIQFAGKIVTLSFYAKKGADYSAASDALSVTLQTGTGTDQGPINNFTGYANPISTTATLTSTWQRFSFTSTTLDSALTQIRVAFLNTPVGTAGAADYYEITGVQLDIGSVAQPFRTTFGTLAGELAACQRYFIRYAGANSNNDVIGLAFSYSASAAEAVFHLPVELRTTPTLSAASGTNYYSLFANGGDDTFNSLTLDAKSSKKAIMVYNSSEIGGSFTSGGFFRCNNSATYVDVSAEL